MNLDPRLLREAWRVRALLALTVAAGFTGGVLVILQARRLSQVLAAVFLGAADRGTVMPLLLGLLAVIGLRPLVSWLGEVLATRLAVRVKNDLRERLLAHLFALGPGYTQGEETGELAVAAVQGVEGLDAYFSQYLPQIALAALVPVAMLAVVFPLDRLSGLILLLTAPLIPLFMILIGRTGEALTRKQWGELGRLSAALLDGLQGLTTLKLLGQSQRAEQIRAVSARYRDTTLQVLQVTFLSAFALEFIATLSTAVVAVQIGLRLLAGGLDFEPAFFILVIAPEFYLPLRQLGLRFHAGMSGLAAARRMDEILSTPVRNWARSQVMRVAEDGLTRFPIRLEAVSYRYPGRAVEAVEEVSFSIGAGEQVALVGPTGAGKSTLVHLLMGFALPTAGRITAGGQDLAAWPLDDWRRGIAWVSQRPALLRDTLLNNLRLSRPDATDQQILSALEAARLDDLVRRLPRGLETSLGEGGARLSAGEAQRLALARAFLRDAPLLVLDEPTAHLDPALEAELEAITAGLLAGRAALIIAHRLPTVQRADRVLVLDAGRVVEQGRPADLADRDGLYARLLRGAGGPA
jgi:ATP-binding cassette subfamily C protein CydD